MTAEAIFEVAREENLCGLGLINHVHPDTPSSMFDQSREEIEVNKSGFDGRVLLGAELDLLNHNGDTTYAEWVTEKVDFITLGIGHYQLDWVEANFEVSPEVFLIAETEALISALRRYPIDIVVHPYIYVAFPKLAPHFMGKLFPGDIPRKLVDELAQSLLKNGTYMEYHCRDIVVRPERLGGRPFVDSYFSLMNTLRERGVPFVAGSDSHRLNQIHRINAAPKWAREQIPINE